MEIEDNDKIKEYLSDKNNFKNGQVNNNFNKYFLMKRQELENILINKCNDMDINDINDKLKKIKNSINYIE